jgi:hypothetical protein
MMMRPPSEVGAIHDPILIKYSLIPIKQVCSRLYWRIQGIFIVELNS